MSRVGCCFSVGLHVEQCVDFLIALRFIYRGCMQGLGAYFGNCIVELALVGSLDFAM